MTDALRDALDRADADWGEARIESLLARTKGEIDQRQGRRRIGLAAAAMFVVAAGVASYLALRSIEGERETLDAAPLAVDATPSPSAAGWSMAIGGSSVALLTSGTDVRALPDEGDRAGFELVAGAVHVDAQMLRVMVAGELLLADAASFELTLAGRGFDLQVQSGAVKLGDRELVAGTHFVFEPGEKAVTDVEAATPTDVPAVDPEAKPTPDAKPSLATKPTKPAAKVRWRALVQSRDWAEAYTEMKRADPKTVRASVDALMAAADAARFGGHPSEAPSYLNEVVEDHGKHAMAPLAAFTLGRVYLEQLAAPSKAARAFAKSRAMAPSGALAADALAREVEAWAKAGDLAQAKDRAQAYLDAYPTGRRVDAVRRHAKLAEP